MEELFVPSLASALRKALTDPKRKFEVMKILGWDNTQVNKYLAGKMGITEAKLDKVADALGVSHARRDGMGQVIKLASVGINAIAADWERRSMTEWEMKKAS